MAERRHIIRRDATTDRGMNDRRAPAPDGGRAESAFIRGGEAERRLRARAGVVHGLAATGRDNVAVLSASLRRAERGSKALAPLWAAAVCAVARTPAKSPAPFAKELSRWQIVVYTS